ncbi:hypothetical protein Q8F55_005210 [Vanrija albida]|uniref:DUF4246 domain-containing protein n=1 Tax=Vanrija albida TaxID=181172 RepID=A0ABR3Q0Z4_9TREE
MPLDDTNIPGHKAPLDLYLGNKIKRFPIVFYDFEMNFANVRERALYWFINEATDDEGWESKSLPLSTSNRFGAKIARALGSRSDWDAATVARWRERVAKGLKDHLPFLKDGFSDAMFNYCLRELRFKAEEYRRSGIVAVLDGAGAVLKSDRAVSPALRTRLLEALTPFSNIPEDEKDWHPGSHGTVNVLINPSLFPLVYGRTRLVTDRDIHVDSCLASYGLGNCISVALEDAHPHLDTEFSRRFQWLPANVDVGSGKARIVSYINNLHPVKHRDLYGVVEELIDAALPMWSAVYGRVMDWSERWPILGFSRRAIKAKDRQEKRKRLVIVQFTNIELTPEKPEYHGGKWHVEGLINERICATALYYYDVDNVTPSRLSFGSTNPWYPHNAPNYNKEEDGQGHLDLGSVQTREGRLLAFPNVFLHKVEPFELVDKTRPGHRKLVALFLVDPMTPVLSTANVPPQQKEWSPLLGTVGRHLSQELVEEIESYFEGPFDRAEALRLRDELIAKRRNDNMGTFFWTRRIYKVS